MSRIDVDIAKIGKKQNDKTRLCVWNKVSIWHQYVLEEMPHEQLTELSQIDIINLTIPIIMSVNHDCVTQKHWNVPCKSVYYLFIYFNKKKELRFEINQLNEVRVPWRCRTAGHAFRDDTFIMGLLISTKKQFALTNVTRSNSNEEEDACNDNPILLLSEW